MTTIDNEQLVTVTGGNARETSIDIPQRHAKTFRDGERVRGVRGCCVNAVTRRSENAEGQAP